MNYASRLALSIKFEERLIEHLKSIGWSAWPWGQILLPPECRKALTRSADSYRAPNLLRWMPDILACIDRPNKPSRPVLIDAKVCKGKRYSIEISALRAAELYNDPSGFNIPTFFVFDDWSVLTPLDVRQHGFQGPFKGNGSGTPFLLVKKRHGRPFDYFFPSIKRSEAK